MQPGIVRGPRGVQMDEVWAAADAVLALGERPTIERVRQQLGRGSPNTVGPMLDGWYGALAKRLREPADAAEQDAGADAPLPAPVIRAAKALWGRALQHADERALAQFTKAHEDLNNQAEALRLAQEALTQETERLAERSEAYGVAMQAKDAQIAEQGRMVQELQQQLASNQEMLAAARSEILQLRLAADADRRRHEAKEVEHQAERTRLEERAQAQERRLNVEVDRARQEVKRFEQQLETEAKRSTKTLTEALDRERELDKQLGLLTSENAVLTRDLASSRGELNALQSQSNAQSREMLNVLSELRDRLPASAEEQTAGLQKARRKRNGPDMA